MIFSTQRCPLWLSKGSYECRKKFDFTGTRLYEEDCVPWVWGGSVSAANPKMTVRYSCLSVSHCVRVLCLFVILWISHSFSSNYFYILRISYMNMVYIIFLPLSSLFPHLLCHPNSLKNS